MTVLIAGEWPTEPLLHVLDIEDADRSGRRLAARLDVGVAVARRWMARGLTDLEADRIATRLGRHPSEIWDGWLDIDINPEEED